MLLSGSRGRRRGGRGRSPSAGASKTICGSRPRRRRSGRARTRRPRRPGARRPSASRGAVGLQAADERLALLERDREAVHVARFAEPAVDLTDGGVDRLRLRGSSFGSSSTTSGSVPTTNGRSAVAPSSSCSRSQCTPGSASAATRDRQLALLLAGLDRDARRRRPRLRPASGRTSRTPSRRRSGRARPRRGRGRSRVGGLAHAAEGERRDGRAASERRAMRPMVRPIGRLIPSARGSASGR